jgi:MFS family permease
LRNAVRSSGERHQEHPGWGALLTPEWIPSLTVLLGGVLLHSMNVLLVATVLPSIVAEVGGAALMSWPTTAYLAFSIVAATCTGLVTAAVGPGRAFAGGAVVFCVGTLLCALAPVMGQVIVGRFLQGGGGGLLSAVAYVVVRGTFPESLWPRVFALLASVWSISVLVGPLVGGAFATYGNWRGAFFAVAALAGLLALVALRALPTHRAAGRGAWPRVPGGRVALLGAAIAAMSLAAIASMVAAKACLILAAVGALVATVRLDRAATASVMPGDAFSVHSPTGVGLWVALFMSIAFVPLQIFVPVFLQRLHGLDPLAAGYTVAGASMAWTVAAIAVAGLSNRWPGRMIIAGPVAMGIGLLGIAIAMPRGPVVAIVPMIILVGGGIGVCWAFTAQRIMTGARRGQEEIAASSVATVQQTGLALGAAVAGLVANAAGFSVAGDTAGTIRAAFWVPASFILVAAVAGIMGVRLAVLTRRAGLGVSQPTCSTPAPTAT